MSRSITPITILLLALSSVFFVILFQLYQKFHIETKFSFYHNHFDELRILEKDFNIFLLNPIGFMDYDTITAKQEKFETLLTELEKSDISETYKYDFEPILKNIHKKYLDSAEVLEYQKSLHAMSINKMSYIFDLHKTIVNNQNISDKEKKKSNEIVFMLIQFLNGLENRKNLQYKLINFSIDTPDIKNLNRFYKYSNSLFKDILELSQLPKEYLKINLQKSIRDEIAHIDKLNSLEIEHLQNMSLLFSSVIAVLMIILIVLHRVSLSFQESLKVTASVFRNMEEGIIITDENQKIIDINKAITRIFGFTREECLGRTPEMFQSGTHSASFYKKMWNQINEVGSWQGKVSDLAKDGRLIPSWMSISAVKNSNNEIINYIAIHRDLTDMIASQKRVDYLAFHDSLTQLPNRISFEDSLISCIKSAQRNNTTVAILFIDLDRFKIINDSLGHDIGDKLLQEVAKRLQNSIRELDSLARIGGDEFVVTLENVEHYFDVSKIAKKILANLAKPFEVDGHTLNTTASIGISQYPKDAEDAISLVKYADSAMYKAKENGKNRFSFFTNKMSENMNLKLELEQELRKALTHNELYMNFQPQYLLKSKKVIALEALIRWNSDILGQIGPDKFIPVAEDSGLIQEIGYFVFRESCKFMKELRDKGIYLEQIAINVSSQQFQESNIVEEFINIVDEYGLSPKLIEIEITERYIMESTTYNMNILDTFKAEGFKISIDDFGTGYSSMSYLKKLPLNTLKIDKSFVDELPSSLSNKAISKAIITLANSLQHHCIAEGIETKEQEEFLLEEGCEIGQGYYFSKPLSKEECLEFIISH